MGRVGAAQAVAGNAARAFSPRFGDAVLAVDHVVASGGDFLQKARTGQIRGAHGLFIHSRVAIVGNISELDRRDGKSIRVSSARGGGGQTCRCLDRR